MRKYLAFLFSITFFFGYALHASDPHRIAAALGVAIGLGGLGAFIAHKSDIRVSAFSVAFLMCMVWLGR